MLNQRWRKLFAKAPQRRATDVRLSVESLEARSLLAGLPLSLLIEMAPATGAAVSFDDSSAWIGSVDSFSSIRGWTAQELAFRSTTVIVIVGHPPVHSPPAVPPSHDHSEAGPGTSHPIGDSGLGRSAFGGFGSSGRRRDPIEGEGEPPDVAPIGVPSTSAPGTSPTPPPAPPTDTGLESPTAPLGKPSNTDSTSVSNLPTAGSNFIGSVFNDRAPAFSASEIDAVWSNWSASRFDLGFNSSTVFVVSDRITDVASWLKTPPESTQDATDELPDEKSQDEAELDASATGLQTRQVQRRDARANRSTRGLSTRPAADHDWASAARPSEDIVDAILAQLHRSPATSEAATDDTDEGGLIEVIVAAAADRPEAE